jgi:type I restriction-modification system DNA methylase subunit
MIKFDRYYTPSDVAQDIVSKFVTHAPNICVDSTCGSGELLSAISNNFNDTMCFGIDKDTQAISRLRMDRPHWNLTVADLFKKRASGVAKRVTEKGRCDLLVLNPPFSMENRNFISTKYRGFELRSSVAMAHILRSIELFSPIDGALIIVPESLQYSTVDKLAREKLDESYKFEAVASLPRKTFKGANVQANVIKLSRRQIFDVDKKEESPQSKHSEVEFVRGNLQVHNAKPDADGIPFIHSTSFKILKSEKDLDKFPRVSPYNPQSQLGWALLIPRVGVPRQEYLRILNLTQRIQLSDCVIAITCPTLKQAEQLHHTIKANWSEFFNLYTGTGARYVTLERLREWFYRKVS